MVQAIEISFDDRGTILVPEFLRSRLGLFPGTTLIVEEANGEGIRLRVQPEDAPLVEENGVLVAQVTAVGELDSATRNERDRRLFELLQRVGM